MTERVDAALGAHSKLSNIEKYERIRTALLDIIERTDDGDPLVPERTLAEDLNVARMTVRKVVDVFVAQGLLRRVPGKGTFVHRPGTIRATPREAFSHYLGIGTAPAEASVLSVQQQDAGARTGQRLQLAPSARVLKIERLLRVDGEPVAIERIHLPGDQFPEIEQRDLGTLLLDELYQAAYGLRISRSIQVLRVTSVTAAEAELLGIAIHSPAFFVTTLKLDAEDRALEYAEAICRGDKYRFLNETVEDAGDPSPTRSRFLSSAHFTIN